VQVGAEAFEVAAAQRREEFDDSALIVVAR